MNTAALTVAFQAQAAQLNQLEQLVQQQTAQPDPHGTAIADLQNVINLLLNKHKNAEDLAAVKKALAEAMVGSASDDLTLSKANTDFALICEQLIDAMAVLKSEMRFEDTPANAEEIKALASINASICKAMHLLANRVVGNDLASKASAAKVPPKHRHLYAQKYSELRRASALNPDEGAHLLTPAARLTAMFAVVETSRVAAETHVNALPKDPIANGNGHFWQKQGNMQKRKHAIMADLGLPPVPPA